MSFNEAEKSPHYVLKQAETKEEISGIMEVIWEVNHNPYDPVAQLFFPIFGYVQTATLQLQNQKNDFGTTTSQTLLATGFTLRIPRLGKLLVAHNGNSFQQTLSQMDHLN